MRKIFIILPFLFSLQAFSQSDTTKYYKSFDYGWKHKRAQYDSALTVPKDTVNKNAASIAYKNGSFFGKDQYGYKPFVFQGSPIGDYVQNQSISAQAASMWINARGHYGGRLTLDSGLLWGNLATDPTGVNGLTHYNTTLNQFRGYRNGAWKNFLMTGDADTINMSGFFIQNQTAVTQTAGFKISGFGTILGGLTVGSGGAGSTSINVGGSGIFSILESTNATLNNGGSSVGGGLMTWERGTNVQGRYGFYYMNGNTSYTSQLGTVSGYVAGTLQFNSTGTQSLYTGQSFGASFIFDDQTTANNPNAISLAYSASGSTITVPVIFKKDGTTVLQKLTQTQPTATTAAATTTIDLSTGNIFQINLAASITTLTLNNATPGKYYFQFTQDATGSRTVAWPASFKWPGGTTPTLSAANKTDIITATYDGTNFYASSQLNY
jgi:hypothetical protein